MAKDHYIPASVIGRFSPDARGPARERVVFALYIGQSTAVRTRAKNIGYENDLYRVPVAPFIGSVATTVDTALHGYESELPRALGLLEQAAPIDIRTWLRTLVPYVASIFVRGHDFIPRFMDRRVPMAAGDLNTAHNANKARVLELERLLAPVCAARWVVLHKVGGEPFVLNDLGLTATFDSITDEPGRVLPIGQETVLGIFPRRKRAVAAYHGDKWWSAIEYRSLDALEARNFNGAMARLASSYVVGSNRHVVERLAPLLAEHTDIDAMMEGFWPFDYKTLKSHERDWHRLVTATADELPPNELGNLQKVDPKALAAGWCPPVSFTINMREFPTGLRLVDNKIWLTLETPTDYSKYFITQPSPS